MTSPANPQMFTPEAVRDRLVNLAIDLYRVRATHEHYDGVDIGKIMRYSGPPGYQARDGLDNLTFVPWDLNNEIPAANRHREAGLQSRTAAAHHIAAACTEQVSWQIHDLLDQEIEEKCKDEWESFPEVIFPRVVRFLDGLPPLTTVFDREEKMAAFQARARIPEKVPPTAMFSLSRPLIDSQAKLVARWRLQNGVSLPSFESFWVHVASVVDGVDTILTRKHLRKDVPLRDFLDVMDKFLEQYGPKDDGFERKLEARLRTITYILQHGGMEMQQEAIKLKESFKEIEHRRGLWEIQTSLNGDDQPTITTRG